MTVYAHVGEQIRCDFFFQDTEGVGVAGLTATVDVYDPTGTKVLSDQTPDEVGGGLYTYATNATSAGHWRMVGKTAGTVVSKHLAGLQIARQGGPIQ